MNKIIAKYLFYYPIYSFVGQPVWNYIKEVKKNQFKSLDEIEHLRNEKIKKIIRYAYKYVPFYKEKWSKIGIDINQIKKADDLKSLPILTKRDILKNKELLISTKKVGRLFTRKTGGSTGMTLHLKKEAKALALNDAIMYRCYSWYGIDIGDKQVRFWGVPVTEKLKLKEAIKDFVLNRIRISAFDISKESCLRQFEKIKKFNPDYFYGYTTAIYGFCLYMKELDIDLKQLKLKAVICTAEKMYPHHKRLFEEVFNCPIVDEYGCAEHGIIAFQCPYGNMHIMADHLYVEFLDENNHPVSPGSPGRIVITDLSSFAMPLIRYDIGDIGVPDNKRCECGINLPLMKIVEGRTEDFIKTIDGKYVHAAYLCYTLKDDTVHEFKMYQKAIDKFHVQIVKSPLFDSNSEKMLEKKLRTALGDKVKITFEYVDRIEREKSGKLRYFVCEC